MRLDVFFLRLVTLVVNYFIKQALIHMTRTIRVTKRRQPPSFHTEGEKVIMKKFIQIFSLFGLLVVFGSISASAQAGLGVEVNIPFAFNVGDQTHEAGSYIVRVDRRIAGASTLSIRNADSDDQQTVLLNSNGEAGAGEVKLVFDVVEGRRILSKVRTPERTYGVYKTKNEKSTEKARNLKPVSEGAGSDGSSLF